MDKKVVACECSSRWGIPPYYVEVNYVWGLQLWLRLRVSDGLRGRMAFNKDVVALLLGVSGVGVVGGDEGAGSG